MCWGKVLKVQFNLRKILCMLKEDAFAWRHKFRLVPLQPKQKNKCSSHSLKFLYVIAFVRLTPLGYNSVIICLHSAFQVKSATPWPQRCPLMLRNRRSCEAAKNLRANLYFMNLLWDLPLSAPWALSSRFSVRQHLWPLILCVHTLLLFSEVKVRLEETVYITAW